MFTIALAAPPAVPRWLSLCLVWSGSENTDAIIQILNHNHQTCLILFRKLWWVCEQFRGLKIGSEHPSHFLIMCTGQTDLNRHCTSQAETAKANNTERKTSCLGSLPWSNWVTVIIPVIRGWDPECDNHCTWLCSSAGTGKTTLKRR